MNSAKLLELLAECGDDYISGTELARCLSVSRTAVWKQIEQLREQGYVIDSVTNKGYRLSPRSDVLNETEIARCLTAKGLTLRVFPTVTSTNTLLKAMAAEGAEEGTVVVAGEQTAGRGRMGRSFFSPSGTGVYLSFLLRPQIPATETTAITACAAVSVAETIEALSGERARIKWVNDVFVRGKKVCGILTEASIDCESRVADYLVVGIGVNIAIPPGDFPEELREIAGAAFGTDHVPAMRSRLAAGILDRFFDYYRQLDRRLFFDGYKRRCFVLGHPVTLLTLGRPPEEAEAVDIAPSFALVVRCRDGSLRQISSGEISVRMAD